MEWDRDVNTQPLKQEMIGIIFNWDISTKHLLPLIPLLPKNERDSTERD